MSWVTMDHLANAFNSRILWSTEFLYVFEIEQGFMSDQMISTSQENTKSVKHSLKNPQRKSFSLFL